MPKCEGRRDSRLGGAGDWGPGQVRRCEEILKDILMRTQELGSGVRRQEMAVWEICGMLHDEKESEG